jgi:hypothetical protein
LIDQGNQLFGTVCCATFMDELKLFYPGLEDHPGFFADLSKFVHTIPKLPSRDKIYLTNQPKHGIAECCSKATSGRPGVSPNQSRLEIIDCLQSMRPQASEFNNAVSVVDLAFYTGRYMDSCDWKPFFKAVFERNPVSVSYFRGKELNEVHRELTSWPGESIYDGNRLALPDEVVNFKRGDGIEKAIVLANVARSRSIQFSSSQSGGEMTVLAGDKSFEFNSSKNLVLPEILSFD